MSSGRVIRARYGISFVSLWVEAGAGVIVPRKRFPHTFAMLANHQTTRDDPPPCMICYGGLEVGRTRALYQYPEQLARAGISNELRRCCLYCLNRGVCVLDSEWHFVLYCPHFRDLRNNRLRNIDIGSEFLDSPRPSVALINLLSLCAKEPTRLQSLGSFARLSLRLREKWLQESVSCGLQFKGPPFDFSAICENFRESGKIKGGTFEIRNFRSF